MCFKVFVKFHILIFHHIWEISEASHLLGRNGCGATLCRLNVPVQPHEQSCQMQELLKAVGTQLKEFVLVTLSTFVSLLLEGMINLLKRVGDENSIVLVGNQLWHCLAQRHSITSEPVPGQGHMMLGGHHLLKNQQS